MRFTLAACVAHIAYSISLDEEYISVNINIIGTQNNYRDARCPIGVSGIETGPAPIFTYHDDRKTWQDAQAACEQRGANLASIHSAYENQLVCNLVQSQKSPGQVWIGGNDIDGEGTRVWSDGTPWDYENWHPNQSNNSGDNEDCFVINFGGPDLWYDNSC